ncbi:MAG: phosphoribosyltransferase family protein [Nitrospira sp.]
MLKSFSETLLNIISIFLDNILPPRSDYSIVKKLDEKEINALPKAPKVDGLDWIHPLFHYKDRKVKAVIWELKYRDNTMPLDHIGRLLFEEIISLISDLAVFNTDAQFVLIPIPITKDRRRERGYNQSEYICRSIIENDNSHTLLYAPQWFEKTKETSRQSHSESRQQRIENLRGCFKANNNVEGKYIILIDDVVTTGSTLSEARKTLLSNGARDVFAFTIAH